MTYTHWYLAMGAIIFVSVAVGGRAYMINNMGSAYMQEETSSRDLDKISSAHVLKNCLSQGDYYIDSVLLDLNADKDMCELCGICSVATKAEITDIETGMLWSLGYVWEEGRYDTHSLTVNIKVGDHIHAGKMTVKTVS